MSQLPVSPLTGSPGVKKVYSFKKEDITELYRLQLGLDVSRFFYDLSHVDLYECNVTGYRFYYPASVMGDGKFYEELQLSGEKSGLGYYRSGEFDHLYACNLIQQDERVLDIGSGNGTFLKSLLSKTRNITGIELNEYTAQISRREGLEIFDELIEAHAARRPGYYDVICNFQVLEHVYDVKNFIEYSLKALKPGGKFIVSVPNNEPFFCRYNKYETLNLPPHHMGLWNGDVFQKLEQLFPVRVKHVLYTPPYMLKSDTYFRVKGWIGSKSLRHNHTMAEKVKMGLLLPLSILCTLRDAYNKKRRSGQICILFEKNK